MKCSPILKLIRYKLAATIDNKLIIFCEEIIAKSKIKPPEGTYNKDALLT